MQGGVGGSRPILDRSGLSQPGFGLGYAVGTFPGDFKKWQVSQTSRTNPSWAYPLPFNKFDESDKYWDSSTIVWLVREKQVVRHLVLDTEHVRFYAKEESRSFYIIQKNKNVATATLGLGNVGTKRSFNDEEKAPESAIKQVLNMRRTAPDTSIFFDLDKFSSTITLIGVLRQKIEPFMNTGRGESDYGQYSGTATIMNVVPWGYALFPNMFNNLKPILPGDKLYVIVKKVPRRIAGRHINPDTKAVVSADFLGPISSKELTIDVIFYTSPNNEPPPRLIDLRKTHLKPDEQPPLWCRQYKEFNNSSKPNEFELKDGLVFELGIALHRYSPTSNIDPLSRTELVTYSQAEMNAKQKMEVFLDIKRVWF